MGAFASILKVVPLIVGAIGSVEQAFRGKGRGPEKRDAAIGQIVDAVAQEPGVAAIGAALFKPAVFTALIALIRAIVGFVNAVQASAADTATPAAAAPPSES